MPIKLCLSPRGNSGISRTLFPTKSDCGRRPELGTNLGVHIHNFQLLHKEFTITKKCPARGHEFVVVVVVLPLEPYLGMELKLVLISTNPINLIGKDETQDIGKITLSTRPSRVGDWTRNVEFFP